MRSIAIGLVVGFVVFFGLLGVFGGSTGEVELVLWLLIAIASGILVARASARSSTPT